MSEKPFKKTLFLIITLGFLLRLAFIILSPPFEIADGIAHFAYVSHIAEENELPVMKGPGTEHYQSPLYYLIYGKAIRASRLFTSEFSLFALRLFDAVLGISSAYFTYKIGRLLFKNQIIILGMTAFAALLPALAYFNAHITNVNMEVLISTMGIYVLLLHVKTENNVLLVPLGIILGLAVLVRMSLISLAISAVILFFVNSIKNKKFGFAHFIKNTAIVLLFMLLVSGWWFIRNYSLYGDFFGGNALRLASGKDTYIWNFDLITRFLGKTFVTFWASFGISHNIYLTFGEIVSLESGLSTPLGIVSFGIVYGLLFFITLLAIFGIVSLAKKGHKNKKMLSIFQKKSLFFMCVYIIFTFVISLAVSSHDYQPQGKFLYPAIAPIGILFVLGITVALSKLFDRKGTVIFLVALLLLLDFMSLAKLAESKSYISYLDVLNSNAEEKNTDMVYVLGRAGFSPSKISVKEGDTVTLINNDDTNLPWLNGNPNNIIIITREGNYVTSKIIKYGDKFEYKIERKGIYKLRNGNYGEVQLDITVN